MRYRFQLLAVCIACISGCASHSHRSPVVGNPLVAAPNETVIPAANAFKHKVAVARFVLADDATASDDVTQRSTEQAKQLIETQLQASRHFMVLDHDMLHLPLQAKDLLVANDETLGADFLVLGELVRNDVDRPGLLGRWRDKKAVTTHSEISLQLIDAHTHETVFSENTEADASDIPPPGQPPANSWIEALQARSLSAAVKQALPALQNQLLARPWQSQILSAQQGYFLLNSGAGQGIRVGDLFHVAPASPLALTTPLPASAATAPPTFLATLKVIAQAGENENELSVCEVVEGGLPQDNLTELRVLSAR